jgi:putative Holliday junction resolvase
MSSTPPASARTVLGFDFGGRRIGVAVGQEMLGSARALEVVGNGEHGPLWERIDAIVAQWRPDVLVVGLPLTMTGEEQSTSRGARAFAAQLRTRYAVPVLTHDERLTSIEADSRFALARRSGQRRQKDAAIKDAIAAQILLESWFSEARGARLGSGHDAAHAGDPPAG